jgi:D-tyrosyl-tRNA(Tyr) deacylase
MRAVIQRVDSAAVYVEDKEISRIGEGLFILLGIGKDDDDSDVDYLSSKIPNIRIFEDNEGKMNLSLKDIGGEMLIVSQFTLFGDVRKGRRPSFTGAAEIEKAEKLYKYFIAKIREHDIAPESGIFQAKMRIKLINNGPVTLLMDSKRLF